MLSTHLVHKKCTYIMLDFQRLTEILHIFSHVLHLCTSYYIIQNVTPGKNWNPSNFSVILND